MTRPLLAPRPTLARAASRLALVALVLAVATRVPQLGALARMTNSHTGGGQFGGLQTYLDNLQKSLLPLCLPLGSIGLAGGGVAYMLGNHMPSGSLAASSPGPPSCCSRRRSWREQQASS